MNLFESYIKWEYHCLLLFQSNLRGHSFKEIYQGTYDVLSRINISFKNICSKPFNCMG
jgi:hypothetical protein